MQDEWIFRRELITKNVHTTSYIKSRSVNARRTDISTRINNKKCPHILLYQQKKCQCTIYGDFDTT